MRNTAKINQAALVESGFLMLIGLLGFWGGINSYLNMDSRMQSSFMKPGFYVLFLSTTLILTSFIYACFSLKRSRPDTDKMVHWLDWMHKNKQVLYVFGSVVLYGCLIGLVGYTLSTLIFLLLAFSLFGVTSWWKNAMLSIATTSTFFLLFIEYGGMIFPRGVLLN